MSTQSEKDFKINHRAFRLKPLMLALALFTPLSSHAITQNVSSESFTSYQAEAHHFHQDHILGTSLDVVLTGVNQADAHKAVDAIHQEISRLDQILSTWRSDSEISTLNQNKTANVSTELYDVIAACENWRGKSCGAFDARLGQLIGLWEKSNGVLELDQATRDHLIDQLKKQDIQLDGASRTITLSTDTQIAPDAYAKGYIIDRALVAARQAVPSVKGLLVDIGGDIRVWGNAPQKDGWKIGVQDAFNHYDSAVPSQILKLNDQAIAFSGKGYRNLAGQTHLLDPKTGLPLQNVEQCVVVGQCAADADALATALAAMQPNEGMQLIEALVGYEAQLTTASGQKFQSSGWNNLVHSNENVDSLTIAAGASQSWPAGYQAVIALNIPKINVENYRIPYVSVWVTDSDKKLVRTLAVWGKDQKWINSNYVWWRRYGRVMNNLDAVAKPSRKPGEYKLAWDGKDDHGQKVAAGNYIVHIETSREHGEHSYQTIEFEVKAKNVAKTLAAQKEIGAVKLNFQKVN